MGEVPHIGEAARRLNVAPEHLRTLAREGRISRKRRDPNGRVYSEPDRALLSAVGVGRRPRRLKSLEQLPEVTP
jgi:DNA-binding transcriptional MerR regulator